MWNLMAVLRLLHHSWKDVGFTYDGLTPGERACLTREEHAVFVDLLRAHGLLASTDR